MPILHKEEIVSMSRLVRSITHVLFSFRPTTAILLLLLTVPDLCLAQVKANVHVIIDKLPLDREEKMKGFDAVVKEYIQNANWFEEGDAVPVAVSLQLFLTDSPSNFEDRYNCEFLISGADVQYFDKRVRFPYQPGDPLVYSEQHIEPLTGVIDFYVNMVLGNELDKYNGFGGDFYYKRAQNIAALGKFVRTEFIRGWTEREELIKRVFKEPFKTFRRMKDYYFFALYVLEENRSDAYKNFRTAFDLMETVMEKKTEMDEPRQFLDAHYHEIIGIFKNYDNKDDVFKKLMKIDPDHKELYEKHIGGD